ncbi:MAG: type II toxin-antitoxin system ChpB family toxin [Algicola sp.]|nr:type II toxin-antitoxin system ChpB family toxin [Algicola sp.]
MAVFERGDIVRACLNPVAGNELQGEMRPCLVLSPKAFNKLGLTLIAPISQGGNFARFQGFAVTLIGSGTETQGVILVNGVRSVDLKARRANKIETAPGNIVDEALAILSAILD